MNHQWRGNRCGREGRHGKPNWVKFPEKLARNGTAVRCWIDSSFNDRRLSTIPSAYAAGGIFNDVAVRQSSASVFSDMALRLVNWSVFLRCRVFGKFSLKMTSLWYLPESWRRKICGISPVRRCVGTNSFITLHKFALSFFFKKKPLVKKLPKAVVKQLSGDRRSTADVWNLLQHVWQSGVFWAANRTGACCRPGLGVGEVPGFYCSSSERTPSEASPL